MLMDPESDEIFRERQYDTNMVWDFYMQFMNLPC
jgi:hypothetical protein